MDDEPQIENLEAELVDATGEAGSWYSEVAALQHTLRPYWDGRRALREGIARTHDTISRPQARAKDWRLPTDGSPVVVHWRAALFAQIDALGGAYAGANNRMREARRMLSACQKEVYRLRQAGGQGYGQDQHR